MCLPTPKSRPPPRPSSHQQSEKDRFRSGSSSGSATDGSLPLSPDPRKRQLPVGRVATSHPRPGSSSAKYSATPPTRRKSTRRDSERVSTSATPRRKSSNRGSAITSPALSQLNYKISGATPRTKSTPRIVRTPATSTQTTPRVGVTPAGSPRKGSSLKAYSTTSSQGRLSVATAEVASLAASTSPLLRPGGGSSRASSDAGSSRTGGSDTKERKRSSKTTGLEGLIGLGITTEVSPKKKRTSATASVKAPVVAPITAAAKPVAPAPTIKVNGATIATASPPAIPSSVAEKSPIGPSAAPTEAKTATVQRQAQPPQRPPMIRKNAYVTPSKLRQKGSSSSLSSDYSDSASSESTMEAAVPELSGKAPSSYAYIPTKLPITSVSKPAALPEPEPEKETEEELPKETTKIPPPPITLPKLVALKAALMEHAEEPLSELVKDKQPPPPPVPQTPAKKPSPTRDGRASSRASTETVDYAAFVAESQKKKKQQKLNTALLDSTPTPTKGNRRSNSVRARAAAAPALAVRDDTVTTARKTALARMKTEIDADSDADSDASTEVSSVAPATDGEFPHRLVQLRRQSKPAAKIFYDTDSSSVLSYCLDGARPEVPFPPPYAPSPPPISRRGSTRVQQHAPPQGAAESWYMDIGAGPREVEQDWVNSAEIWEQDPVLPEAPSPPVSRTENRHSRRRSQRKSGHGYGHGGHKANGYYGYTMGHY